METFGRMVWLGQETGHNGGEECARRSDDLLRLRRPGWDQPGPPERMETCGRMMWLGQETGHNVRRPATTARNDLTQMVPLAAASGRQCKRARRGQSSDDATGSASMHTTRLLRRTACA